MNGAFAKTFRSGIQPVEIASALRREADTKAAVVSRERILTPGDYVVRLSPEDHERMQSLGQALNDELLMLLTKHARTQGYSFSGPLRISLEGDPQVALGTVRVNSSTVQNRVAWQGVIEIDGQQHAITRARSVIGRGSDADITITDAGSSRRHAEILWDGEHALLRDLGSTNGTKIDGERVREAALSPGSSFTIGRTQLIFRVVPVSTGTGATR